MKTMIEIKNVKKCYDDKFTLDIKDLTIPGGVIVGLIGENGAGKTTLIKSILNMIGLDQGNISIFGKNYIKNELEVKEEIGVVLDNVFFPEILTPRHIHFIMKDIYTNWDKNFYFQSLENFSLPENKKIKQLSKGMRKKLEIITALSHHPKLLILDEPTSGLDPVARAEILELFLDYIQDDNHTILLSTHITSDLEQTADYILFLKDGKIVIDKSRDELMDQYGILKCDIDLFDTVKKEDILYCKKNKYHYDILVSNRELISKKYPDMIIDQITLDELMVLMIKGEKEC